MGKVSVSASGNDLSIVIPQALLAELGLDKGADYELVKAKDGIWVLTKESQKQPEKPVAAAQTPAAAAPPNPKSPLDERIFYMLEKLKLEDKVEGKFEARLGKAELARFKELLKDGAIIPFKLTPQYKKAVYKAREEIEGAKANRENKASVKKESEISGAKEKPIEDYCIERDGIMVCRNEDRAKMLSNQFKRDIEEGRIRGIKDFSGLFYIIENSLYDKYKLPTISAVKANKNVSLQQVSEKLGVSPLLAKIVCEFLKEEGEIIEKRKELFQSV
jgi:antitoxin component of MazEF toxin-antitoxin module